MFYYVKIEIDVEGTKIVRYIAQVGNMQVFEGRIAASSWLVTTRNKYDSMRFDSYQDAEKAVRLAKSEFCFGVRVTDHWITNVELRSELG